MVAREGNWLPLLSCLYVTLNLLSEEAEETDGAEGTRKEMDEIYQLLLFLNVIIVSCRLTAKTKLVRVCLRIGDTE